MNLDAIIELSHEFGTPEYVKGGGGNTSAKDETTLWVKPSGTTLKDLQPEQMVGVSRAAIEELFAIETPATADAREELVKNHMAAAVTRGSGRPSVEAPLHHVFSATYVVHTHMVLINGMTCAKHGEEMCAALYPDALWVEYIDPGYTLCMEVRKRIEVYRQTHGHDPALLILKNHGVFVAADTSDGIRELYDRLNHQLSLAYSEAGCSTELSIAGAAPDPVAEDAIRSCFGEDAAYVATSGRFTCVPGPINPDYMVYSKAIPFAVDLTESNAATYRDENGYAPKVVVTDRHVYGIGTSQKNANLALEMAQDAAQIMQLAEAFGGLDFMTDEQREFIENWEVESYREKQV